MPKLQFLGYTGLSHEDLGKVLISTLGILRRSLEKNLIPTYNILKGVIGEENAVKALMKQCWTACTNAEKTIVLNVALLREIRVPNVALMFYDLLPCCIP